MNDYCKQAPCKDWYEFKVLGKGKKQNELLDFALANDKIPNFRKTVVHSVCVACIHYVLWKGIQPNESCEKQLHIIISTTNIK
jgi:hypothetical protein